MKKTLFIFTLTFSAMFLSPSYAGWTEVVKDGKGNTFYVDFERMRKVDGQVYWWQLADYLKPDQGGDLSVKVYAQGDCKLFRLKSLSFSYHKEPMGEGIGLIEEPNEKFKNWLYPPPDTSVENILKSVCNR